MRYNTGLLGLARIASSNSSRISVQEEASPAFIAIEYFSSACEKGGGEHHSRHARAEYFFEEDVKGGGKHQSMLARAEYFFEEDVSLNVKTLSYTCGYSSTFLPPVNT